MKRINKCGINDEKISKEKVSIKILKILEINE